MDHIVFRPSAVYYRPTIFYRTPLSHLSMRLFPDVQALCLML